MSPMRYFSSKGKRTRVEGRGRGGGERETTCESKLLSISRNLKSMQSAEVEIKMELTHLSNRALI